MRTANRAITAKPRNLFTPILLAIILAALFWKSFLPGYVHFSNDGPLGQQNAAWRQLPAAFTGSWYDLNDIGSNTGVLAPDPNSLIFWVLGPFGYAKFLAPIALLILGLGAWAFFRQLKLTPLAATLGALAATLNSAYFATACWGVAPQQIAIGMDFFALALVVSNTAETPGLVRWARLALAGLATGINVMEAADIGAIFSLLVALFIIYKVFIEDVIPLIGIERVIVLCCVNGAFLSLFILGVVFGLGIFKLCLLLVFLVVATLALNWSLIRKLIPLTKTERIVALSLVDLAFLLLFICGIMHGFGFFPLALLLIVAVVLNWVLLRYHLFVNRCGLGVIRLAVIAVFAGFIATQTVVALVGTEIQGVVGTGQDTESKAQHWDWATQWSLPKIETLGLFVPGVFGYKYDTPKDMMESLQGSYQGGVYWGAVGRDPEWDRYFAGGEKGPAPQGILRFAGGQNYAGILVALLALWAIAQSLRRQNSAFAGIQRRLIWFWAVVLIVSLLLAWGRFAPFYKFLYMLPYFSTIRNPAKFVLVFSFAIVTLFAYGIHALNRRYLETPATGSSSPPAQLKNWWAKAGRFDRNWTWFCLLAFVISVITWLAYSAEKPALARYLREVGFPDPETANQMAAFSVGQSSWFILLFALAVGLCLLTVAGVFAGKRARLGGVLLGVFLVADLGRADLPYITHWDYKQKYASNPIIDFLRDKPYEHRVAYGLPRPLSTPPQFGLFDQLYRVEWMQHHFPYYNIQSLDVIQRPRMPADLAAFEGAFQIGIKQDSSGRLTVDANTFPQATRLWELTNTRYLLGPAGLLELLNEQFDPVQQRFRIIQRFDLAPKPGVEQVTGLEQLTAVPGDNGPYALIEFTGALPRAKMYSQWQTSTNDTATLQTLASKNYDAWQTVLVSTPLPVTPTPNAINDNSGTVAYKSYAPKNIVLDAKCDNPSVLLLNDKFDPLWRVLVDGKPAELLRCNFIMRGVYLTPGAHTVELQFSLPNSLLYVTLTAMGAGLLLCGFLIFSTRRGAVPAV